MATSVEGQRDHAHCTFCDLIRGAAEVSICHDDADAIAFMDIQPVNNGHVLVVPRVHYESLLDVPQELGIHLFQVTMRLANAVRRVTGCDDFNIVVNSGAAAGQDEPHYHVHIIPRREGDGFDIPLPFNGSAMPDRTLLDAYAARIGLAMRDPAMRDSTKSADAIQSASNSTIETPTGESVETLTTADTRNVERSAQPSVERAVALPTFDESESTKASGPSATEPGLTGMVDVHEGAHGELTYDANPAP